MIVAGAAHFRSSSQWILNSLYLVLYRSIIAYFPFNVLLERDEHRSRRMKVRANTFQVHRAMSSDYIGRHVRGRHRIANGGEA